MARTRYPKRVRCRSRWSTTASTTRMAVTTGIPPGRSALSSSKYGPSRTSRDGTTARESFTTSDSPWYIDNVPSVMISTGSRRPTASTPLTTPSRHPKATPMPAARKGSIPLRIASAATTAEKLNIHPIDRSISRIASRNTMPRARMPTKVLLADRLSSVLGSTNAGRTAPTSATNTARATMTPSSSGSRRRRGCGRGRIRSVTSRTDDSRVVASVPSSRSSTMVSSLDPIPRESPLHRAARQRRRLQSFPGTMIASASGACQPSGCVLRVEINIPVVTSPPRPPPSASA